MATKHQEHITAANVNGNLSLNVNFLSLMLTKGKKKRILCTWLNKQKQIEEIYKQAKESE